MSLEIPQPILDSTYSRELAISVVYEEIKHTEGFKSLTAEQQCWFEQYAAPLLVNEGLETGRAVERELADDSKTQEELLSKEVEAYSRGLSDLREYYGRGA
jgi:hypothetical protein